MDKRKINYGRYACDRIITEEEKRLLNRYNEVYNVFHNTSAGMQYFLKHDYDNGKFVNIIELIYNEEYAEAEKIIEEEHQRHQIFLNKISFPTSNKYFFR